VGGRYALRSAIGTGGMGTVWRASDTLLRREVAVKEVVCPGGLAASDRDAMYERTLREARAAAALSHPSVVQVYDVVTEDGRPWIVMELLDARSLADMVIEDGPLAPRAVAKIGIALLGALEVAHAAGVLHRDVKPANVLICADGRCVLTDFGVARMPTDIQLTTPGMVLGSPHFISPERAMGGAFGPPSDLFSLGVSLYTAVEGRPPFDRGDPIETMHAVVEEPPAPPVRAGPIAGVLHGLLEKDPARRWDVPTARSVLRDLLAGPLANRSRDHVTDPYAVVPPQQRQAAYPGPPVDTGPGTQIGGRAMLSADEPLEDAIARAYGAPRSGHRRQARRTRLAVIAGVAAITLVGAVLAATKLFGNPSPSSGQPRPSASPSDQPLIPIETQQHGAITINVPAGWRRTIGGSYVDFVDPADPLRKIRVNIETASDPRSFLGVAERNLKKVNSSCPGYARVELRDATLAGQPAAELEYTCTQGAVQRHGLWRATVSAGKAYHFFMTVPEPRFADSKIIFDELVRSFKLNF
jgi:serine/threonine protein kinase